jgi:hypothetical protein
MFILWAWSESFRVLYFLFFFCFGAARILFIILFLGTGLFKMEMRYLLDGLPAYGRTHEVPEFFGAMY